MTNEKKTYLCEHYAQRLYTIAAGAAQEAAGAGKLGGGLAVVAHEALRAADRMLEYVLSIRFEGGDTQAFESIAHYAEELFYLSINAELEMLRVCEAGGKDIAVFVSELKRIAAALREVITPEPRAGDFVLLEAASSIQSSNMRDSFFRFAIGGAALIENAANVMEVFRRNSEELQGDTVAIRGNKLPVCNLYKRLGLTPAGGDARPVMVVRGKAGQVFAVAVDDFDDVVVFRSGIGAAARPAADHLFGDCARECWDAVGGGQLVFLDWEKLFV